MSVRLDQDLIKELSNFVAVAYPVPFTPLYALLWWVVVHVVSISGFSDIVFVILKVLEPEVPRLGLLAVFLATPVKHLVH